MTDQIRNQIKSEVERTAGWTPDNNQVNTIVAIVEEENSVREAVKMWQFGYCAE